MHRQNNRVAKEDGRFRGVADPRVAAQQVGEGLGLPCLPPIVCDGYRGKGIVPAGAKITCRNSVLCILKRDARNMSKRQPAPVHI